MRHLLILFIAGIAMVLSSCTPSPEEIIHKSREKCQSVENGYYEMTRFMKYSSGNDTAANEFTCYFKKLPDDTLYPSTFHYERVSQKGLSSGVLYTGEEFVRYQPADSSGTIMSKERWADDIRRFRHNYKFYDPLVSHNSDPLTGFQIDQDTEEFTFEMLADTRVNGFDCYHIVRRRDVSKDTAFYGMRFIRVENQYWIHKLDYIPVQYTEEIEMVEMEVDTVTQYEKNVLTNYEINKMEDTSRLSLSSVPGFIQLQDYVPYKRPELLEAGTPAPDWSLQSLNDERVNLTDLRGNLVLIDFFYKACHPCMLALPGLQRLHENYADQGLHVIGINPHDTKEEDEIDVFLDKRGINYTVLLSDRSVPEAYHVSGYPTMYLIGHDGKVIHTQVGYGESTEESLEKVILDNL